MIKSRVFMGCCHTIVWARGKLWGSGENSKGNDDAKNGVLEELIVPKDLLRVGIQKIGCKHSYHNWVLSKAGRMYGCGRGNEGEFADSTSIDREYFSEMEFFNSKKVSNFWAVGYGGFVMCQSGVIYILGGNVISSFSLVKPGAAEGNGGKMGMGTESTSPRVLDTAFLKGREVKSFYGGGYSAFVLSKCGSVWGSGSNHECQLGFLNAKRREEFSLVPIFGLKKPCVEVSPSFFYVTFFRTNSEVFCSGQNNNGQLGLGHQKRKLGLKVNPFLSKYDIVKIELGSEEYFAITADCKVLVNHSNTYVPTILETKFNIVDVIAGDNSRIFVSESGLLLGCGRNAGGELCLGHRNYVENLTLVDFKIDVEFLKEDTILVFGSSMFSQCSLRSAKQTSKM